MDPTAQQPSNYVPPPTGGGGAAGGAGSKGPWIIGGAVILVGIIIAVVLIMTVGRNPAPVTPSASLTPSASPSPSPSPTPTRTRSPRPSPSSSPSASPTAPPVNNTTLVREAVEQAAEAERPGQLKHVGSVAFMDDQNCSTGNGASASARFDTSDNQPPAGTYFLCQNASGRWKVTQGPIYGE